MNQQWNQIFKREGKIYFKPREELPKIIKLFKKRNVKKVLDLGCGSGRHTVYLAKNSFEVYGIDISPIGIKLAKEWLKEQKLKASFKLGNIYRKLPYRDNSFDAIIATQVINHGKIENIRKLIKEIKRILKPDGLIFVTARRRRLRNWRTNSIKREIFRVSNGLEKIKRVYGTDYRIIGPRTYVPIDGGEKGLIHYVFDKKTLRHEFRNFKIHEINISSNRRHYCLLGEIKK